MSSFPSTTTQRPPSLSFCGVAGPLRLASEEAGCFSHLMCARSMEHTGADGAPDLCVLPHTGAAPRSQVGGAGRMLRCSGRSVALRDGMRGGGGGSEEAQRFGGRVEKKMKQMEKEREREKNAAAKWNGRRCMRRRSELGGVRLGLPL